MTSFRLPPRSPADLDAWLATSPPLDVAIALGLALASLLAAYVTVAGLLYLLALLLRAPRAVRALTPLTPARIRTLAERAVAASLLTATWAAPATAAVTDAGGTLPPGLRVPATADAGDVRAPALDLPTVPAPSSGTAPVPEVAPPRRPTVSPARAVVHVAPGDHLWLIAARALAAVRGVGVGEVPDHEVATYWREVVRANRPHLRSGDPDLIHPGEEIRLPPAGTDR